MSVFEESGCKGGQAYAYKYEGSNDLEAQKEIGLPLPDDYRNFFASNECRELALAI